jgi:transposase-like protein
MARRGYPPECRCQSVGLVGAGSRVSEVAADLGIGE